MKKITIHHSPDADDAFMFYGLVSGKVQEPGYEFDHSLSDIQSLNEGALNGELDVTAISVHAYPYVAKSYSILACGASMGGVDYGPRVVATKEGAAEIDFGRSDSGRKLRIATPGKLTSATLAMKLFLAENNAQVELQDIPFDQIQTAVIDGDFDAGVIIHEGQITHQRENLVCVLDLGEWWWSKHALPLPLGVNVVRKELGEQAMRASYRALKASIETSLAERSAALDYALGYGRGITPSEADQFVGMYVNELTVDMGSEGRRSIELFLNEAAGQGIIDEVPVLEYVDDNSLG